MTAKEQQRERLRVKAEKAKSQRDKNKAIGKKVLRVKQKAVLRRETRRHANLFGGTLALVLIILFSFTVFKFALNDSYQFSLMGILKELSTIPMISIVDILTANLNFPTWLQWLESLLQVLAVLGSMIANAFMVIIWFLRFLFT